MPSLVTSGTMENSSAVTLATEAKDPTPSTSIELMLDLEEIDKDLYRSKKLWVPMGARGVFGGNVVGQALVAATNTVSTDFSVHSLHSYFLLPGDPTVPILYHVERVRDGRSYSTRTVTATQRGQNVFVCTASFQVPRPGAPSHQYPMPDVPHHSALSSQEDLIQKLIENPKIPEHLKAFLKLRLEEPVALDFKDTSQQTIKDMVHPSARTEQAFWIRCKDNLGDALALHQCVVAYGSDHNLLTTAPLAHGSTWFSDSSKHPKIRMMASLDHSMWFHCPFRADEWMLYVCESPRSGCDRGLTFGRIYKEDGTLAVSVAQEGVVRLQSVKPSAAVIEQPKL
ncbi:Acyl-CoA thioesterase 8 [Mortierella alpina]|nr:Acyl-CoA thioesterase 8 [Mortierella alpina]